MRPYYAEGSKTLAFETAEQLGWELPDRVVAPIASGSLFTKIARGFEEWLRGGPDRGQLPAFYGAQARGLFAGGPGLRGRSRHLPPGKARHDRQVAGHRQPGRRARTRSIWHGAPRAASTSVTDDEIRAGIALLAETTGIFTETAGGVTTAVLAKLAERGDIGRDERVVLYITGEGLKTLDAVRGSFETIRGAARRASRSARRWARPRFRFPGVSVNVKIPAQLRAATGGEAEADASGSTVGEVLDCLFEQFGDLRERICEDGDLRRFVNVYVGGEDIRFLSGLETEVSDGDEVTILPAVAGG